MAGPIQIEQTGDRIYVSSPYNPDFVDRARMGGGRWDRSEGCWVFAAELVEDVRAMLRATYGRDDSPVGETVRLRVRLVGSGLYRGEVRTLRFAGREVAWITGRDSGARLGEDVVLVEGKLTSGGSRANPRLVIRDETVLDLLRVPRSLADEVVAAAPGHAEIVEVEGPEAPVVVEEPVVAPVDPSLPDLVGTERQIARATVVRTAALAAVERYHARLSEDPEDVADGIAIIDWLRRQTDAAFWDQRVPDVATNGSYWSYRASEQVDREALLNPRSARTDAVS